MRDAVIVDAVRTPTGKRNGALKDWHPVDLSAHVLTALVERTGIDPALVDDVIWGVVSTWAERSTGCQSFSAPLRFPVGVRTASTITASRMVVPSAQVPSRVRRGRPAPTSGQLCGPDAYRHDDQHRRGDHPRQLDGGADHRGLSLIH